MDPTIVDGSDMYNLGFYFVKTTINNNNESNQRLILWHKDINFLTILKNFFTCTQSSLREQP